MFHSYKRTHRHTLLILVRVVKENRLRSFLGPWTQRFWTYYVVESFYLALSPAPSSSPQLYVSCMCM